MVLWLPSSTYVLGSTGGCGPWLCRDFWEKELGYCGVAKAQWLELSPTTSSEPTATPRKQKPHPETAGCYGQPQLPSECPEAPPPKQESFCQHRSGIRRPCPLPRPQVLPGPLPRQAVCPLFPTHVSLPPLSESTRTLTSHGFPLWVDVSLGGTGL